MAIKLWEVQDAVFLEQGFKTGYLGSAASILTLSCLLQVLQLKLLEYSFNTSHKETKSNKECYRVKTCSSLMLNRLEINTTTPHAPAVPAVSRCLQKEKKCTCKVKAVFTT